MQLYGKDQMIMKDPILHIVNTTAGIIRSPLYIKDFTNFINKNHFLYIKILLLLLVNINLTTYLLVLLLKLLLIYTSIFVVPTKSSLADTNIK